jgi:hypothetical protein
VTRAWFLFVLAMDSLCRTIGTSEMYPFVLTCPVIGKVQRERSALPPAPAAG